MDDYRCHEDGDRMDDYAECGGLPMQSDEREVLDNDGLPDDVATTPAYLCI